MVTKWQFAHYLSCLILLFSVKAHATLPAPWSEAAKAYREGDYRSASRLYEELVQSGYCDPALYYNLGKSYVRQGKKGRAILALERALLLDPSSDAIQTSLDKVRETLSDQIPSKKRPIIDIWALRTGSCIWSGLALLLFWLGGILWFWGRQNTYLFKGKGYFLTLLAIIIGMLFLCIAFYADFKQNDWRQVILLARERTVHQAPDQLSPEFRRVHEGTKLYILECLGDWAKVRLENGDTGWIPQKGLVQIAPIGKRKG